MTYPKKLTALIIIISSIAVYAESPEKTTAENKKTDTKLVEKAKDGKKDDKKKNQSSTEVELDPETKALQQKQQKLSIENLLKTERLKNENADLLARLQKIRWEKEVISEQLAIKELKHKRDNRDATIAYEEEVKNLTRKSTLEKLKTTTLSNKLAAKRVEWDFKKSQLNAEIDTLKIEKERAVYADSKPVYLDNPLKDNNTLVISDRRIALNGVISSNTANYITTRINYYNNKDIHKPIFIVIDYSPGGSVMAGYRILKAMEGSRAPVYVVLKSYAASMAATMVTLSKKSFAYPNAVMLHHQISSTFYLTRLNLTQQKEHYAEMTKWWTRLAAPIAAKMGITTDDFIKQMYEKSSDGDWSEFASDAKKLNWVDHIVERIEETSLLKDPNSEIEAKKAAKPITARGNDKQGRPIEYLPRLSPKDMYFLYNPDQYYQLQ